MDAGLTIFIVSEKITSPDLHRVTVFSHCLCSCFCQHHDDSYTLARPAPGGGGRGGTYWKASGQSSLDIHCHLMCEGVGNPRAVHLSVGLLP